MAAMSVFSTGVVDSYEPSIRFPTASMRSPEGIVNAMTVDVEDYFQVSAFDSVLSRADWDRAESRVRRNTEHLLEMFAEHDVRATFFVLGWVAERFPGLVRTIVQHGHEIASHGYEHRLVYQQGVKAFREDLRRARFVLEAAAGAPVLGYRAPSYSITRDSMWALDVLVEEGFEYDASIYPVHHDRYGIPDAPRHIHRIERSAGSIWELPGSTVRWGTLNLPMGGGGYFRLLPYEWTRRGVRHLNAVENQPAIFYLHPWEIDPQQPRLRAPLVSRIRHYTNLAATAGRLNRLMSEFRFGTVTDVLGLRSASVLPAAAGRRAQMPAAVLGPASLTGRATAGVGSV
jgi:polysaccharide deacetylase family protein (PEP-CTERM system associated)